MDRPTDGRTYGQTDTPSYRDARTHLKMILDEFLVEDQLNDTEDRDEIADD